MKNWQLASVKTHVFNFLVSMAGDNFCNSFNV